MRQHAAFRPWESEAPAQTRKQRIDETARPGPRPPSTTTRRAIVASLILLASAPAVFAGPRVDVVVADDAPKLEKFAAAELAAQLKRLFDADVRVAAKVPAAAGNLILIGSPATNPAIARAIGANWPKLSDQGHLLKSVGDAGALIVGGASPVATLWAVYELGHRYGIRYLLHGDYYPAQPAKFKLDSFDLVFEPELRLRAWRTINDFAIGPESWGLADQKKMLHQLAKLKFNRVVLAVYPWQPFVHYEFRGVKKQTGMLWYGQRYPVAGDTPGRDAFGGATEFDNPDFAGKRTYEERLKAGVTLASGIIDAAHELGMSAALAMSPLEFPKEFAKVLPGAKVLHTLENLVIGPGDRQPPDDPLLKQLTATQIRAYLDTYPRLDALYLTMPEFPDWVEHHEKAWHRLDARTGIGKHTDLATLIDAARKRKLTASGERGIRALKGNIAALDFLHGLMPDGAPLKRRGSQLDVTILDVDPALYPVLDKVLPSGTEALHFVDYTARRVAEQRSLLAAVPAKAVKSSLILTLADDNVGVLPQLATNHLHELVTEIRKLGWQGFSTRYWIPGDLEASVFYLARAGFDGRITPKSAYHELFAPMCGPGAVPALAKGFAMIEEATTLIDRNDLGFTFPVPGMVMRHYDAKSPPPAWWKKVSDLYGSAMDEIYRAQQRAHPQARPLTLYHAKRCEFAIHYIACLEAVRRAGLARDKKDRDGQVEHLESAVEAMHNALSTLGEVARDQSDRGVIAVVNAHGYRPLRAELDRLRK
ncbi:MAG: hypothetical protein FJ271_23850 [Planctomycetes bacterium]|nr:hypothetical protein [Planctomycetota bacterium]